MMRKNNAPLIIVLALCLITKIFAAQEQATSFSLGVDPWLKSSLAGFSIGESEDTLNTSSVVPYSSSTHISSGDGKKDSGFANVVEAIAVLGVVLGGESISEGEKQPSESLSVSEDTAATDISSITEDADQKSGTRVLSFSELPTKDFFATQRGWLQESFVNLEVKKREEFQLWDDYKRATDAVFLARRHFNQAEQIFQSAVQSRTDERYIARMTESFKEFQKNLDQKKSTAAQAQFRAERMARHIEDISLRLEENRMALDLEEQKVLAFQIKTVASHLATKMTRDAVVQTEESDLARIFHTYRDEEVAKSDEAELTRQESTSIQEEPPSLKQSSKRKLKKKSRTPNAVTFSTPSLSNIKEEKSVSDAEQQQHEKPPVLTTSAEDGVSVSNLAKRVYGPETYHDTICRNIYEKVPGGPFLIGAYGLASGILDGVAEGVRGYGARFNNISDAWQQHVAHFNAVYNAAKRNTHESGSVLEYATRVRQLAREDPRRLEVTARVEAALAARRLQEAQQDDK